MLEAISTPPRGARWAGLGPPSDGWIMVPIGTLAEVSRVYVGWMLVECKGNKGETAKRLGISRATLRRRLGKGEV